MIIALTMALAVGVFQAGGIDAIVANARQIPGFLDFFGMATNARCRWQTANRGRQTCFRTPSPYAGW
jgi:hypothetical protein